MEVTIREFGPADSLAEITDLLHRAYTKLAEQGMRFVASHQDVEITRQRIESGFCFVALNGSQIVGTITLYTGTHESKCEYYLRPGVARFGQFAVEPLLQGSGLGRRLLERAEGLAAELGCGEIALDTAEGAHELIAYYSRCGYSIVDKVDWDTTNYVSVVMTKSLASAAS